jgi:hypothetical protein
MALAGGSELVGNLEELFPHDDTSIYHPVHGQGRRRQPEILSTIRYLMVYTHLSCAGILLAIAKFCPPVSTD